MARKFIYPGQSIGLRLTAAERKMLIEDVLVLDDTYITRIKDAPADRPKVAFTLDELDDLAGCVAAEANHCKSRKKQKVLDAVHRKIERLLETHTDDKELARQDALAEAAAAGIAPSTFDPIRMFLAELEGMGLDVDAALENIKPKRIAPDERIPVGITVAEKKMLLELPGMSEALRSRIGQPPPGRQTTDLTLREAAELESLVASHLENCSDNKQARKCRRIASTLSQLKYQYIDGSEPTPQAAAMQELLMKLIEARRKKG